MGTRADTQSWNIFGGSQGFLNVKRSIRGLHWRERLKSEQRNNAIAISQRYALPELLGRVLASRNVELNEVDTFLSPTLKHLMPNPSTVRDMDVVAARIADAIVRNEKIAVFGDYDVDGACSSALMKLFLGFHNVKCRTYIPDRLLEGYGPNSRAFEILADEGVTLIITVDCGTTSFEPLMLAKRRGLDVVIIDHHQADEHLPEAIGVVNPNRHDDLSGLGQLCAAGVVFLVLVAVSRELRNRHYYTATPPDLMQLLDLVALATVCDVVPLTGLNRAYVNKGLRVMHRRNNVGLTALFDAAGLKQSPTCYHLGFVLGPRINAGGRIGNSELGVSLLATEDVTRATNIAIQLDKLNRERKIIEAEMLAAAMVEGERLVDTDPELAIIILSSQSWHKGVVGLVASRLTERFNRPSCVISWDGGGYGTGSLRSISGVDIGAAVRAAVVTGHLVKGGGHAMAAGLTVKQDNFTNLSRFFLEYLNTSASRAREAAVLELDGALTPQIVTPELMAFLERAGPYGQGNPQPRFAFGAHVVKSAKVVGDAHVRCVLQSSDGDKLNAIAFRSSGQPLGQLLLDVYGRPIHIAGTLRRDTWGGHDKVELFIDDAVDPSK
ncbi:MAG: Single-stranded-DNA-specific exonuclease RecJ [Hyphomicrobiaceae bacterium hypho_1]